MRVAGLCVMGWVLTASGSLAGPRELLDGLAAARVQSEQRPLQRAEVVDAWIGAELRLTAKPGGALQASLVWMELDVNKIVQADGDFQVRVAATVVPLSPTAWRRPLLVWGILLCAVALVACFRRRHGRRR